ncbi:TEL2 family protein [Streptomyces sp. Isolate_219]|uniref:TEL2 family protein n=1 Tax=Streptomyces sp. Isolate_219 TaxID=2950110 RepID=UPI0021C921D5|nr:TEL2 family protein [Streptomyces sp. Isolate_219]MCR8578875.1 TEL2 family protein [Streptomyces sp. Isolate_219]
MSNERQIQDEDLMDVAQDPEQAHRLRKALKVLAENPNVGGKLQEMAKEVLSGRIGMKEAIETPRYMDALGDRMNEIRRAAENQTMAEREESREKFAAWQKEQEAKEDEERAERDGPTGNIVSTPRRGGRGGGHRG